MKKLLLASIILFACSLGFFGGALYIGCCKTGMSCPKGMMAPPDGHGKHGPDMDRPGKHGPDKKGPHHNKEKFQAEMDSVLQVTPEQKAALDQQRNAMDSSFRELHKQKMEAEKMLKEALENDNLEQIKTAKASILAVNEALLDQRIQGASSLSKILTPDQREKFRNFHKEKMEKFKELHEMRKFHKGVHKGEGPKPEAAPQE